VETMNEVLQIALEKLPGPIPPENDLETALWQTPTVPNQTGNVLNS
jgi:hypothetical protein